MQNNPQELSWQAIQAIVGVKLSVDVLRFDDIGFHLVKSVEPNVIELDSDIEIVEDESDNEPFSDINGNGRSGTSEGSTVLDQAESSASIDDTEKCSDGGGDVDLPDKENTWSCPTCSLRFFSKGDRAKHMENLCEDNDNSVDNNMSIDDYLEVTLSTDSEISHSCGKCDQTFSTETDLSAHTCVPKVTVDMKHGCHVCTEKFTSYWELRKHINTHFPGMMDSKSSYCHICQKDYTKTGFMNHLRKHTGERPFVCELCQKAFSQSSSLSIHMKFHLNVRKHACTICDKKFVTKSELSRHMTVHTKQKSYYCGVCDKAFTRSDNMKKHEKTHGWPAPGGVFLPGGALPLIIIANLVI